MYIFPTDEEVEQATQLLVNTYRVSPQLLGQLFGTEQRDQSNSILQSLGGTRLTALDVARLLVQREGPSLFAGSRAVTRELRLHLLGKLKDDEIQGLFNRHPPSNRNISSPSRMRKPLSEMKWHSGKYWAKDFVAALDFPPIFAGFVQGEKVPTFQDVPPLQVPPIVVPGI